MTSERIDPDLTGTDTPVVTYSRVAPRKTDERREPTLEASRVLPLDGPVLDRPADAGFEDADFADVTLDLRAERGGDPPPPFDGDVVAGLYDDGRRSRPLRFVLFGAFLAFAAGIGVLASSLSAVTGIDSSANEATSQPATLDTAAEPPPPAPVPAETANLEPLGAAEASAEVRKISLGSEASEPGKTQAAATDEGNTAAASAAVPVLAPPVPRPRPEPSVAVLEPPAAARQEPAAAPQPLPPAAAAADAPGTDALITRIEETLARRQSASTGAAPNGGQAVLPPPPVTVVPPGADEAYVDYYGYPREEGYGYPADDYAEDGPWVYDEDVVPPPLAREEYYPAGPVPPAPVPYGYPADSWQDGPGAAYRGEKEPNFIKRAMNRTSDLMARVGTTIAKPTEPYPISMLAEPGLTARLVSSQPSSSG